MHSADVCFSSFSHKVNFRITDTLDWMDGKCTVQKVFLALSAPVLSCHKTDAVLADKLDWTRNAYADDCFSFHFPKIDACITHKLDWRQKAQCKRLFSFSLCHRIDAGSGGRPWDSEEKGSSGTKETSREDPPRSSAPTVFPRPSRLPDAQPPLRPMQQRTSCPHTNPNPKL